MSQSASQDLQFSGDTLVQVSQTISSSGIQWVLVSPKGASGVVLPHTCGQVFAVPVPRGETWEYGGHRWPRAGINSQQPSIIKRSHLKLKGAPACCCRSPLAASRHPLYRCSVSLLFVYHNSNTISHFLFLYPSVHSFPFLIFSVFLNVPTHKSSMFLWAR